jgi:predicted chitinase
MMSIYKSSNRVENQTLSLSHIRSIWKSEHNVSDKLLSEVAEELNSNVNKCQLNTELRMCHFIAQVMREVGGKFNLEENLNYSEMALISIFSHYGRTPSDAKDHAYNKATNKKADIEAIANHAYANRMGNGSVESGDGWKYRGRGMLQLTGKSNYISMKTKHNNLWSASVDFVANPDLLLQPKFAVRSALIFWLEHQLYKKADIGASRMVTDSITKVINSKTTSYSERHDNLTDLLKRKVFKDVF